MPSTFRSILPLSVNCPHTPAPRLSPCKLKLEDRLGRGLLLVADAFIACPVGRSRFAYRSNIHLDHIFRRASHGLPPQFSIAGIKVEHCSVCRRQKYGSLQVGGSRRKPVNDFMLRHDDAPRHGVYVRYESSPLLSFSISTRRPAFFASSTEPAPMKNKDPIAPSQS